MSYLERRRNLWYAVLTIPKDAREKLGRMRFIQSLGTPDKAKANILAAPILARWKAMIREARGATNAVAEEARRWKQALEEQPLRDEAMGDPEHMGTLELLETIRERLDDIAAEKGSEVVSTMEGLIFEGKTLTDEHFEDWKAQLHATEKTKDQMIKDLPLLTKRFPTLQDITKTGVKKWLDDLRKEGKTLASMERILGAARNYWKYLQQLDKVPMEANPFQGVLEATKAIENKVKKRGKTANLPYAPSQVLKLYESAQTGWGKRPTPDPELAALIMLGAYTGARIEELCSLKVEQVSKDSFRIGDSKTAAGIREVPIHSKIASMVEELKKSSDDGYLISGLSFNKYGDRSNAIGKRFGRLKDELGFGRSHTFHSFRATVVTQLENAGVSENLAADIVGHEKPRITYGLYSGGASLEVKRAAIEKIAYRETP